MFWKCFTNISDSQHIYSQKNMQMLKQFRRISVNQKPESDYAVAFVLLQFH